MASHPVIPNRLFLEIAQELRERSVPSPRKSRCASQQQITEKEIFINAVPLSYKN
jgi:hypothetical protein